MKKLMLILLASPVILGIGLYICAAWPTRAIAAPIVTPRGTCFAPQFSASESVAKTNEYRVKAGLRPLIESALLENVAQLKLADMLTNHYYSHVSPTGVTPWHWFTQAGYKYVYAGENLAQGSYTSDGVVDAWIGSPEHKENILNPHYTEIGTASVCGFSDKESTVLIAEYGSR